MMVPVADILNAICKLMCNVSKKFHKYIKKLYYNYHERFLGVYIYNIHSVSPPTFKLGNLSKQNFNNFLSVKFYYLYVKS